MKAYFNVLKDHHPKRKGRDGSLKVERSFVWVSFIYSLFDDIVFMIDFFPDSTYTMPVLTERSI
jgi:hypothetical protein